MALRGDVVSEDMEAIAAGRGGACGRLVAPQFEGDGFLKLRTSYQLATECLAGRISNRIGAAGGRIIRFEYTWTAGFRVELQEVRSTVAPSELEKTALALNRARRLAEKPLPKQAPGGQGILGALCRAAREQQAHNHAAHALADGRGEGGGAAQRRLGGVQVEPLADAGEEGSGAQDDGDAAWPHKDEDSDSDADEWKEFHRRVMGETKPNKPEREEEQEGQEGEDAVDNAALARAAGRAGGADDRRPTRGDILTLYRLQTEREINREPWRTQLYWHLQDGTGLESACWRRLDLSRMLQFQVAQQEMREDRICTQCLENRPELYGFFLR